MSPRRSQRLEWMPLQEIRSADRNPKAHDLATLQDSIRRHGFVAPLILDETTGKLVAGHGRVAALEAMQEAGEPPPERIRAENGTWLLPVIRGIAFRDAAEAEAYLVADNRLTEVGGWDEATLLEVLGDLEDLEGTGYGDEDIAALERSLEDPGPAGVDDVPDPPTTAKSARGDTWILGEHRIRCGDATDAGDVKALMGGQLADAVFTDPPYGTGAGVRGGVTWDNERRDDLVELLAPAFKLAVRHATEEAAFYIWHHAQTREDFARAMLIAGLEELQYLIWAKPGLALGHGHYRWAHEPCFYAAKAGQQPAFHGSRDQPTVWRIGEGTDTALAVVVGTGLIVTDGKGHELYVSGKVPRRRLRHARLPEGKDLAIAIDNAGGTVWEVGRDWGNYHPTQKPVELGVRALRNSTRRGGLVLDPFAGSGSTLISAEVTGRRAYVLELEPRYVDVVVTRWERLTGGTAEHLPAGAKTPT